MQENRFIRSSAIIALLALAASSGLANLFEDGTFENPDLSFADGNGWEGTGVTVEDWANGAPGTGGSFGYSAVGDDQYGIAFRAYLDTSGGFYHDVPVEPGRQYNFHIQSHTAVQFYNQVVAGESGTVHIEFSWYDGDPAAGGQLVGAVNNDITSSITDGGGDGDFPPGPSQASKWQDWDYSLTATPGASHLRCFISWTAAAVVSGGDEVIRWDNAELTTALDPLNETQETLPVLELSFPTQSEVIHTVESSTEITDLLCWTAAGVLPVIGDDTTQRVYLIPDVPEKFFRIKNER